MSSGKIYSHNSSFGTEQGLLRLLPTQPHRKYQSHVHNSLLRTHQFVLVPKLPLREKKGQLLCSSTPPWSLTELLCILRLLRGVSCRQVCSLLLLLYLCLRWTYILQPLISLELCQPHWHNLCPDTFNSQFLEFPF